MNGWPPAVGGGARGPPASARSRRRCAQLVIQLRFALLMARSEPIADASLPAMRGAQQARHRDRRDDADDGHDDQQFDQREASLAVRPHDVRRLTF